MLNTDKMLNSIIGSNKKKNSTSKKSNTMLGGFDISNKKKKDSASKKSNTMLGGFGFNMNFDSKINSIIGNKNQLGASMGMQNKWKNMGANTRQVVRMKYKDTDGDGVPDRFDCSPRNPMRQDEIQTGMITAGKTGKIALYKKGNYTRPNEADSNNYFLVTKTFSASNYQNPQTQANNALGSHQSAINRMPGVKIIKKGVFKHGEYKGEMEIDNPENVMLIYLVETPSTVSESDLENFYSETFNDYYTVEELVAAQKNNSIYNLFVDAINYAG